LRIAKLAQHWLYLLRCKHGFGIKSQTTFKQSPQAHHAWGVIYHYQPSFFTSVKDILTIHRVSGCLEEALNSYHLRNVSKGPIYIKLHFAVSPTGLCQCKYSECYIWIGESDGSNHRVMVPPLQFPAMILLVTNLTELEILIKSNLLLQSSTHFLTHDFELQS